MPENPSDIERNRLTGRVRRYGQVGAGVGGYAVKEASAKLLGMDRAAEQQAAALKKALGGLKGPIMKLAQMMATVPDLLPEDFAQELKELQTNAPAMGWPFVRRRMRTELGADWQSKFKSFERDAVAAASLGQVHRAVHQDGRLLACKLQYPDMQSAVEADLRQLKMVMAIHRRFESAIDTSEMGHEIGMRLREELDYGREAGHLALYKDMLSPFQEIHVPDVISDLSTERLLTMTWLDGRSVLDFKEAPLEVRNQIATNMFRAWWHPFSHYGVIHGDPHLGNYTVEPQAHDLNLLDYGCVRIFAPEFVGGVVGLYRALKADDRDAMAEAYRSWGFRDLTHELIDVLNIWAGFIYGPLLDDRVRTIADGLKPSEYGRREAFQVYTQLRELGPITPPREFVFLDRAAIGLGSVFLHLSAELNFHDLFNEAIEGFDTHDVSDRQRAALTAAGLAE